MTSFVSRVKHSLLTTAHPSLAQLPPPDTLHFNPTVRFGLHSAACASFHWAQGLLAVGTYAGTLHIFGCDSIHTILQLDNSAPCKHVLLHSDKAIVIDARGDLSVFSLESLTRILIHSVRGPVTCIHSDPALDWLFIAYQDGSVDVWDIDRDCLAPLHIPNLYRDPARQRISKKIPPLLSIALNPKDLSFLLLGYGIEGAVLYSFKEDKAVRFYDMPANAGLTQLTWNPNGTHFCVACDDGSLVFYDIKSERPICSRYLKDPSQSTEDPFVHREPIFRITWACREDPNDTFILVAGGANPETSMKGLHLIDYGPMPSSLTASANTIRDFYLFPKRFQLLAAAASVIDFCCIPTTSPHYSKCHNPSTALCMLSNCEIASLPIETNVDPPPAALQWISPTFYFITMLHMNYDIWRVLFEFCSTITFLHGGTPGKRTTRRFDMRQVVVTAHTDHTLRFWDISKGVLVHGPTLYLDQFERNPRVVKIDFAGYEFAIGFDTGQVSVFKLGVNVPKSHTSPVNEQGSFDRMTLEEATENDSPESPSQLPTHVRTQSRNSRKSVSPSLVRMLSDVKTPHGFIPIIRVDADRTEISSLRVSQIGLIAIGYESGVLALVDMRTADISFLGNLGHIRGKNNESAKNTDDTDIESVTALEFAVFALEDGEKCLCLLTGTSRGRVICHALFPDSQGLHRAHFKSSTEALSSPVHTIIPVTVEGGNAIATPANFAELLNGVCEAGMVYVITEKSVRVLRGVTSKIESFKFSENLLCLRANIFFLDDGRVLSCLMNNGSIHLYPLIGLETPIKVFQVPGPAINERLYVTATIWLLMDRLRRSVISSDGDVFIVNYETELSVYSIWGGIGSHANDTLFDPLKPNCPSRPTISTWQWIGGGSTYISAADLDLLIAGPDRPPSKQSLEKHAESRAEERGSPKSPSRGVSWGVFGDMTRQLSERGDKLRGVEDKFCELQNASGQWLKDVTEFANDQKKTVQKRALLGGLKNAFM
ncbi:Lethal(2) giant larvae SRO7 [Neolecta irregularis DAH-3]|uniref:Lethal(2) giant larvae SRO7 n=1 Tax=Neolecta irregularis (strain DAH-3) TaxID=1198029 RepID=A0A1U7LTT2_NEOID|nr:Lethal(2) giant larvae SRO7 [Neolecta irregularis DAH-3]|eukprot:OLL26054.1 Lethal(2) giant larvae SRO7 [Neolecta irregularis DAH-3]